MAGASWFYVLADHARPGSAIVTLLVDNLEQHVGFLAMRGIASDAIATVPGVIRRALISDPAGNVITVGQSLGS